MPPDANFVFSTIAQTVGAVWALLVIFMWRVLEDVPRNRRLSLVFITLNIVAALAVSTSILGLATGTSPDSAVYAVAVALSLIFVVNVATYYILLALISFEQG